MPAPVPELSSSSISSSGHVDGLGRRSIAFDRETGAMLERVHVRPELAVFERALRDRVQRLSGLEEERFARPMGVERDAATGELVVLAEFVTGSRLSELLEISSDAAVVPGVDVALGYLLETLTALSTLHTTNHAVHGLVDPSRTVLIADGQVVLLDLAFAPAVEALHPSPERLWNEFGIASTAPRSARFDAVGDVTQAALSALMLVLGRNLKPDEYPDALPLLLMEVVEVAHIRGSTAFATGLQRVLQRSLPLPGRRAYATAAEALDDVNQLVRREIGVDVCRQAIVDFVAQMDAAFANTGERAAATPEPHDDPVARSPRVSELDSFLDSFEMVDEPALGSDQHAAPSSEHGTTGDAHETDSDEGEELEISLDHLDAAAADPPAVRDRTQDDKEEEVYDLRPTYGLQLTEPRSPSPDLEPLEAVAEQWSTPERAWEPEPEPSRAWEPEPARSRAWEPEPAPAPAWEPETEAVPDFARSASDDVAHAERAIEREPAAPSPEPVAAANFETPEPSAGEAEEDAASATAQHEEPDVEPEKSHGSSRRRKRQQQKSARARKDKLRSTAVVQKGPSPPPPPAPPVPAQPANPSGWLVAPHRAAASESLIPPAVSPPAPTVRPAPAMPTFVPNPVGAFPQPTYGNPSTPQSVYGTTHVVRPAPPPPPPPPPAPVVVQPAVVQPVGSTLKLKSEAPASVAPRRVQPEPFVAPPDRFSTLSLGRAAEEPEAAREFPWKLAAVAVAVAVVAIIAGRTYLPGRTAVEGELGAQSDTSATPAPPPAALQDDNSPIPEGKGRVLVQTQPPGIKVLVDRKPVGETPLRLELPPGRRVLTFLTSGGEVLQTVRVVAGKTVPLDIPVFSGWVSVVAPFELDIAEDGRSLGTTEQNRIMLPPGRHRLTFSNKDLGYSGTQSVDIEPGGVRSITIDPKGAANLNATPWAEVWLDGKKLGDTPLASTPVPLGAHEFVFKHPQLGERRMNTTIRANETSTLAVDFNK